MPQAKLGSVSLAYEIEGPEDGTPLLMVLGLARQLVLWPRPMVDQLTARGFRVIRFDNRDVGLSTKFSDAKCPSRITIGAAAALRLPLRAAPYTLTDMADDAAALLTHLKIPRAHVAGVSMGGMIGQLMASEHPDRVASLTSISSTSSGPGLPLGKLSTQHALFFSEPKSTSREHLIEHGVHLWRALGSRAYPREEAEIRASVELEVDRDWDAAAALRHTAAIIASQDRADRLAKVSAPTLVVHGDADPLLPLACGRDTAKRIPGARLEVIKGMGHDHPPQLDVPIADLIADHAQAINASQDSSADSVRG